MKYVLVVILLFAFGQADAQVNPENNYVDGHYRADGTYVEGHYRTNPNGTVYDNYSTYPNINPYTGEQGTKYARSYNFVTPVPEQRLFGYGQVQQVQVETPTGYFYTDADGNTHWIED